MLREENETVEKNFLPQMSAFRCDQLYEGVNKLTRRKRFWLQNFLHGNVCVYHRGHLFYFRFIEAY